ncbi:hypothetical protein TNCV_2895431 [Trichonephila clavipes]|nr:hypothetical protein TNCV_2895431 [Trichonephila clavipes]
MLCAWIESPNLELVNHIWKWDLDLVARCGMGSENGNSESILLPVWLGSTRTRPPQVSSAPGQHFANANPD